MKYLKTKRIFISIFLVILIFFSLTNTVHASSFLDGYEDPYDKYDIDEKSEIEETIDNEEGGLFEKIIAKMIRRYSRNCI